MNLLTPDIDQVALEAARQLTPDNDPQNRSRMQCEIIKAIHFAQSGEQQAALVSVVPSPAGQGDALAKLPTYRLADDANGKRGLYRDDTGSWVKIQDVERALAARQPVGQETVAPKKMERAVALDLLHAVYKRHGWKRAEGESMTARVHAIYDVALDAGRNRFVATPKNAAPRAQAVDLGQPSDPGRTLYIDLDGVMADFDGAFPAVFGLDHRSLADDEMWGHINSHPSFFRDLPPMAGALDFFRSVEHLNPVILTACPKSNYPHVAAQKRAWVRAHLSQTCMVLPVLGGRHKPLFMHQAGDVLIDDFGKNCAAWTDAGGIAIKHEGDWTATRTALALIDSGKAVSNG